MPDATLAYATYGTLDAERSNAIVVPTAYAGTHLDNEWLIAAGRALDPERWFVIVPNMFGNGLSTSPSTISDAHAYPSLVTIYDNVVAQHRLVIEHLGVRRVALVTGFSMGAIQTFHWGALFPDLVERIAPFCGAARISAHNRVFLDGIEATIAADPSSPPTAGLRAAGGVWASFGHSQTFYREERWRELGFASLAAFIDEAWIAQFASGDARNLLAMLHTWQHADVAAHPRFNGDFAAALAAIAARAVVMPCTTDLYFPPEDSAIEVRLMPNAELAAIPSVYGHTAGGNLDPAASAFIDARIASLLDAPPRH